MRQLTHRSASARAPRSSPAAAAASLKTLLRTPAAPATTTRGQANSNTTSRGGACRLASKARWCLIPVAGSTLPRGRLTSRGLAEHRQGGFRGPLLTRVCNVPSNLYTASVISPLSAMVTVWEGLPLPEPIASTWCMVFACAFVRA